MPTGHLSLLLFLLPCVLSNHYRTLGVPRSATSAEIRKAYRKKAVLLHPDKRGGSAAAFKQLNEAHEVLGVPSKRRQYDVLGTTSNSGSSTPEREQQYANEVAVFCRLDQLAGLAPVAVLVAEYPYVFSGTAWLPPGSVEGDVVRHTLRGVNIATSPEYRSIEVVLRLYELPNHRFVRHGAHLYAERALPRWHNWRAGAAYVRGLDGSRHCVSKRGERVPLGDGRVHVEIGQGLPLKGGGKGDLVVQVRLRGVRASLGLLAVRLACAQQAGLALLRVVRQRKWHEKLRQLVKAGEIASLGYLLETRTGLFE